MKNKILVFIPMYNCEKQITRVLDKISGEVLNYIDEVLVVNNISTDNSENIVKEYIKQRKDLNITLVTNQENYNLGGSHKVAIKYAQENLYDYLVVLHGDDQANINDLLPYFKSGEYQNYDCLLGARFMKGSNLVNYSKFRVFGNKVFNMIYSVAAGKKLYDLGSGLNLYKVEIFASDFHLRCRDSLTFNDELLLSSVYLKQKIKFFPISWNESDQVSNAKLFHQSKILLGCALRYWFNKKKYFNTDRRTNKNLTYGYKIVARNFDKKPIKVLITGAAGFIGSQLAYRLYKLGYDLVLIDNFSYGKMDNLKFPDHSFESEIIKMDIRDKQGIENLMKAGDIDLVYNIAGIAPLPDCQLDPQNAIEVNVAGLMNIMENARKYGVKKVIQASTNAIYENVTIFPTKEDNFILPTLIYPNTKYCAERFLESYAKTYGMNVTCLRFANVYGPHIDCLRKQPPFVAYMIRELYFDRVPTFHSDGKQKRDYIYVDDLINLALRVTRTSGFECVNCCSNHSYSVNELYQIAQEIMNKKINANFADCSNYWKNYPELYAGSYGISNEILKHEVNKETLCDNSLAFGKYGWVSEIDIRTGLKKVIDYECSLLKNLK